MHVEDIKKFIKFLTNAGDTSLVFQTFGEGPKKGDKALGRKLVSKGAETMKTLTSLQAAGAGVFLQVNGGAGRGEAHITNARAAFLDLDGTPISVVQDAVKQGYPQPHMVVESSLGRYHVYWLVDDLTVQNFSYLQKTLAAQFDGDPVVFNLDRVMRLPGTYNYKAEPFLATIIHYKPELPRPTVGELMQPVAAPEGEVTPQELSAMLSPGLGDSLIMEGYNTEPVSEIEELLPGDRTQKIVRIAGKLVDTNPSMDAESLKQLLVEEVERRTPDNVASVDAAAWNTEIFPAVDRFVKRRDQVVEEIRADKARAESEYGDAFRAFADASDIPNMTPKEFSERFVLVAADQLVYDLNKASGQTPMTVGAFKNYAKIFKGKKGGDLFLNWMSNRALRRTVDTTTYRPYRHTTDPKKLRMQRIVRDTDTGELCYNTYAPPYLKPKAAGNDIEMQAAIKPFLTHMNYLFKNKEKRDVFIDWIAATIQRPERRVQWAPFIISKYQGVGKGWIANLLKKLVGVTNYEFETLDSMDKSQYNEFLAESTVVVVDEVYAPSRPDLVVKLQPMVTEQDSKVNKKWGSRQREQLYANFILFSNFEDALPLYVRDRRFFVHIFDDAPQDEAYYNHLWQYLDSSDISILFDWLLKRDLSKFQWGLCPAIAGDKDKQRMLSAAKDEYLSLIESIALNKEGPFEFNVICKRLIIEYLYREYEVDTSDTKVKNTLDRSLKQWLRTFESVGRLKGFGQLRHETWYFVGDGTIPDTRRLKFLGAKAVKRVFGETSLQYRKIESEIRNLKLEA